MWKILKFSTIYSIIVVSSTYTITAQALTKFHFEAPKMGSVFAITLYTQDTLLAHHATEKCYLLVDSLNHIFSDYDPNSEVSRLASTSTRQWTAISPPLFDLTQKALWLSNNCTGAFDITIGALTQLWRRYLKDEAVPTKRQIRRMRRKVRSDWVQLDTSTRSILFKKKSMRLDFGGIGKGYIADQAGKCLQDLGIASYLIDAGGDLVVGDAPPNKLGWDIQIPWTEQVVRLVNQAVATSGPDYQFFVHKGKTYTHIIDPTTGWGIPKAYSTTIIATSGWLADGLASATAILPPDQSLSVMADLKVVGILGIKTAVYRTPNFDSYVVH